MAEHAGIALKQVRIFPRPVIARPERSRLLLRAAACDSLERGLPRPEVLRQLAGAGHLVKVLAVGPAFQTWSK